MKRIAAALALLLTASVSLIAQSVSHRFDHETDKRLAKAKTAPQILYHGGPVMVGPNHVYVVYYGSFTTTATSIIDTFLQNLGGSGAYNVNSTYYNGSNQNITNLLSYTPANDSYVDSYSQGHSLRSSFPPTELQAVLAAGHLPTDSTGIYLLIMSPDVAVPSGFYCGYHTHSTSIVVGTDIKYAVIPDPPGPTYHGCSGNVSTYGDTTSPNGDIGADSVADTAIHEISETVTDPDINAWYTKSGLEAGDLCNFVYGTTFTATNGSHANHVFGNRQYLVQAIWANTTPGYCALSYP